MECNGMQAFSSVANLLKMEREMGLEPTTSSLGNWANIVNTDFSVSGSDFKRRKITEFPTLSFDCLLTEYKRSTDKLNTPLLVWHRG
jgi:hypothetical protein